ncbi:MAG: hypothetical protein Q4G67_10390 [Actinomycetia bacterium]|nr:hypothetical protein [Actinomycetes bacterium]
MDPVVVREVLENPVAMESIEMEEELDARDSMAQGIVANFMTCRDVARVYEEWSATGTPPPFAAWPEPTKPLAWYRWEPGQRERLEGAVDSGDIEALRVFVTSESGCGNWIPATPGDINGPTIRDHILGEE